MRKTWAKLGSGHVFTDLGRPNPKRELLKARLQTYKIVKARGLTAESSALSSRASPR